MIGTVSQRCLVQAVRMATLTALAALATMVEPWPGRVALAQPAVLPRVTIGFDQATQPGQVAVTLQVLALLTVLSLAPAVVVLMTSFTRIVIVLSFVRSALGTQQVPPNQVLVGLALLLTMFVMAPTWNQVNQRALGPYLRGEISQADAVARASGPMRTFMLAQTREKDLALFVEMRQAQDGTAGQPVNPDELPLTVVIPAFVISELKTAFQMGFLLFVPFLVIDLIVASTLMSMGIILLPPVLISLPFKILLFVLVDGWYLVVKSLLISFR